MPPPPRESPPREGREALTKIDFFQKVRTESSEGYTTKAAFASPPRWFSSQPRTSSKHECKSLWGDVSIHRLRKDRTLVCRPELAQSRSPYKSLMFPSVPETLLPRLLVSHGT